MTTDDLMPFMDMVNALGWEVTITVEPGKRFEVTAFGDKSRSWLAGMASYHLEALNTKTGDSIDATSESIEALKANLLKEMLG